MNRKVGFIGFGSMGKMIFGKIAQSGLIPESDMYVANRTFSKIERLVDSHGAVNLCRENVEVAKRADVLFLCVKPLELKSVLQEIHDSVSSATHIVSLNGSVPFEQLEKVCPNNKLSKAVPSVTAEVNQSQTLVCHNGHVSATDKETLTALLSTFGNVIDVPESEIGIASELVSCMPGFIASLFDEICVEAKKHTELPRERIVEMVVKTVYGTGKLMLEKELSFEEVIARVATKGGITEEGVKVIHERLPSVASEIFEKTIAKRKLTAERALTQFNT